MDMSRSQLDALGYQFVESDLPAIVRDWYVGDSVLCLTFEELDYQDDQAWRKLTPFPIEKVLAAIGSSRD